VYSNDLVYKNAKPAPPSIINNKRTHQYQSIPINLKELSDGEGTVTGTGARTGDGTGARTGDGTGARTGDGTGAEKGAKSGDCTGAEKGAKSGDCTGAEKGVRTGDGTGAEKSARSGDGTGCGHVLAHAVTGGGQSGSTRGGHEQ